MVKAGLNSVPERGFRSEALTISVYWLQEHRERTVGRMNEHDKARPVSGEIMTGDAIRNDTTRQGDVSDAEYETVGASSDMARRRFKPAAPATGLDFLKAGADDAAVDRRGRQGGPLFWSFGLTLVMLAFWISGGHALVRNVVLPAPSERLQPLRIGEVKSRIENRNGRDVLFVDGRAENHGGSATALPPIEITVTDSNGTATRYFLGTNDAELQPGDRYSFSSRLEAPRYGVKSVSVSFREGNR